MGSFIEARRERAARAWGLSDEVVLVGAGKVVPIPGSGDQVYPFRVHPEYRWLTDAEGPLEVLAFDPAEGWARFVPEVTRDEIVWTGAGPREGRPLAELDAWRKARRGRPVANHAARLSTTRSAMARRVASDAEPTCGSSEAFGASSSACGTLGSST